MRRGLILVAVCAFLLTVLMWLGGRLVFVADVPLTMELSSDKPVSGSVSYRTQDLGLRDGSRVITPDQVVVDRVPQREVTVTVTPLGKGNPRSSGSEVWVYEASSSYQSIGATQWTQMALPPTWIARDGTALNASGERVPLNIGLRAGSYVEVAMLTHPWSGRARIAVGDASREVDLYASIPRVTDFRVLLPLPGETGQRVTTSLPASAKSLRVAFSGGPRVVRVNSLRWGSSPAWTWSPSMAYGLTPGPGVRIISSDRRGMLLGIDGPTGEIAFPNISTTPYWTPRPGDLLGAALLAVGVACILLMALAIAGGAYGLGLRRRPMVLPAARSTTAEEGASEKPRRLEPVISSRVIIVFACAWLLQSVWGLGAAGTSVVGLLGPPSFAGGDPAAVIAWWGGRPFPTRDGNDFLLVLSHQNAGYALSAVVGEAARREQQQGTVFSEIIVPVDVEGLLGGASGGKYVKADGTTTTYEYPRFSDVTPTLTDARLSTRDYVSQLTSSQASEIRRTTVLRRQTDVFYLGTPSAGGSGRWILHSAATEPRTYLLIPLEVSPAKGDL